MAPEKFTITFNSSCQVFFISIYGFSKFFDYTVPCLFIFIKITYILQKFYLFHFLCFSLIAFLHSCDMVG